ncbi:hypothetical protein NLX83_15180 [Allokutzneria sp. A3M-2-11 16]|uniref:hypothetical protein n=1 Tax=Allokutzneria sp. A3M-2-11 16 TaxID=2962043 RepID=UPI0020B67C94|nr:hypothetical protein [Allokutzneria sp. A3M-2-11 16]MCP3800608.1 hypothetical protein [Allokutzneria sp. A3M-2-11 16]
MAEDDGPLSPAESLALISSQRARVDRSLSPSQALLFGMWGTTWLVGWTLMFLATPGGPELLPLWLAGVVFAAAIIGSVVLSTVVSARAGRGIAGPSRLSGALYGWTWTLGFWALGAINVGFTVKLGVSIEVTSLLWTSGPLLVMGLLTMLGAAQRRSIPEYVAGVWLLLAASASVYVGTPANLLVLAFAGGGAMLGLATHYARQAKTA